MSVLVLGSSGKLGRLLQAAWPVSTVLTPTWHTRDQFDIFHEPEKLADACAAHKYVLVLAGVTDENHGKKFSDNARLAKAVTDAARNERVFLTSSAAVYGNRSGRLCEATPCNPTSDYGISKLQMEQEASAHPNVSCLRIGNVAGADALLGQTRSQYVVHQFPDGAFVSRSYIGPSMLANVIAGLFQAGRHIPPILNVALPGAVSMTALLDCAGLDWVAEAAPETAVPTVELDTTLLQRILPHDRTQIGASAIVADWKATLGTPP